MSPDVHRRLLAGETLTFPLASRARWQLSGPDRTRYLNGQVTNDVSTLKEGMACYAAVCTAKGRMEGDLFITEHGDAFYLDADGDLRESLGARLEKYLIADDALLEDFTDSWNLSHVFGATPPALPATAFAIRHDRFGLPGHDVWIPSPGTVIVGETVVSEVIETLRLEFGLPKWGAELTANTLPPEAGPVMLDAISYTKGCYVGQETIARLKSVGHVNRTLAFLTSESAVFPAAGTKLMQGEKEVGTVTSGGFSPRLDNGIALGYVPRLAADPGTTFLADGLNLTVSNPFPKATHS